MHCGCILLLGEYARGICDARECRVWHHRKGARLDAEQEAEARRREAEQIRDAQVIRDRLGDDGASCPILLVPYVGSPLIPMPESRRQALLEHLDHIIEDAAVLDQENEPLPDEVDEGEPAILNGSCAVCGGACCGNGGEEAYLKANTIRKCLAADPDLDVEALRKRYLSLVPARSHEGSCIYHAETGCTLPRSMRDRTCNSFTCNSRRRFVLDTKAGISRGFAVALHEGRIVRYAFIGEGVCCWGSPFRKGSC